MSSFCDKSFNNKAGIPVNLLKWRILVCDKMFKVLAFLLIAKCVQSVSLIEHTDIRNESSVRGPKILTKSAQRDVFYIKPQMQTSKLFWQYYNSYNPITVLVDDVKDTKMHTYNFLKNIYSLNPELTQKLSFQLMLFNHSG